MNIYLEPQGQPFKNGCLVISNYFLCKDWVHHPIDSQPFINGWPQGVPGRVVFPGVQGTIPLVSTSISTSPRETLRGSSSCQDDHLHKVPVVRTARASGLAPAESLLVYGLEGPFLLRNLNSIRSSKETFQVLKKHHPKKLWEIKLSEFCTKCLLEGLLLVFG